KTGQEEVEHVRVALEMRNNMSKKRIRRISRNLVWLVPAGGLALFVLLFHAHDWSSLRPAAPAPRQTPERVVDEESPPRDDRTAGHGIPVYPAALTVGKFERDSVSGEVQLCQCLTPAAPHPIDGIDCVGCGPCGEAGWNARRPIP